MKAEEETDNLKVRAGKPQVTCSILEQN